MGKNNFTRSLYKSALESLDVGTKHVTKRAEQQALATGKLNPLVDPAGFNVIRLSLPRVEKHIVNDKEIYELTVGTPMPVETRVDTTGSMGDNVDVSMRVLPEAFELWSKVLPDYDLQVATGIFADVSDNFPLCRPQFEMNAEKIVKQLTLMVPERDGGDTIEDPDIGIFGGAYLVRAYINRIKLKGYDFTVTDAPGRGEIDQRQLERVFGSQVFEKVAENGHKISNRDRIELKEVWNDLLDRAHAFIIQVGSSFQTNQFWAKHCGKERVVSIPDTEYLPYVQAVIIGLTEGTLLLSDVPKFLAESNMLKSDINRICMSVANIPIAAQAMLPNFNKRPVKGDLFDGKPNVWDDTNLWPNSELSLGKSESEEKQDVESDDWL